MKRKVLAVALITVSTDTGVARAASITAQAITTWLAITKKDTTSRLIVTPFDGLAFQYIEGIKGFNSQRDLLDVTIEGDSTATTFRLTPYPIANTSTQLNAPGSALNVDMDCNGATVEKTDDTVVIDTVSGVLDGNFSPLANGYSASNCTTTQDDFTFFIISDTVSGITTVTDYSILPGGVWNGDVSI